ncbi:uncharacterized protein LOC144044524 [Vanacampus margaritifer]
MSKYKRRNDYKLASLTEKSQIASRQGSFELTLPDCRKNTMKVLLLALSVAVLVEVGDGLKCFYCEHGPAMEPCELTEQECDRDEQFCGFVTLKDYRMLRGCISDSQCYWFGRNPDFVTDCCSTDLCNTLPKRGQSLILATV